MLSTAVAFLVFLLFLFFAMQVMFGLYATSTLVHGVLAEECGDLLRSFFAERRTAR